MINRREEEDAVKNTLDLNEVLRKVTASARSRRLGSRVSSIALASLLAFTGGAGTVNAAASRAPHTTHAESFNPSLQEGLAQVKVPTEEELKVLEGVMSNAGGLTVESNREQLVTLYNQLWQIEQFRQKGNLKDQPVTMGPAFIDGVLQFPEANNYSETGLRFEVVSNKVDPQFPLVILVAADRSSPDQAATVEESVILPFGVVAQGKKMVYPAASLKSGQFSQAPLPFGAALAIESVKNKPALVFTVDGTTFVWKGGKFQELPPTPVAPAVPEKKAEAPIIIQETPRYLLQQGSVIKRIEDNPQLTQEQRDLYYNTVFATAGLEPGLTVRVGKTLKTQKDVVLQKPGFRVKFVRDYSDAAMYVFHSGSNTGPKALSYAFEMGEDGQLVANVWLSPEMYWNSSDDPNSSFSVNIFTSIATTAALSTRISFSTGREWWLSGGLPEAQQNMYAALENLPLPKPQDVVYQGQTYKARYPVPPVLFTY